MTRHKEQQGRVGKNKLTKWEAGNELVAVADALGNASEELKDYPELREFVRGLRKQVAARFEEDGFVEEMGFGI